MVTQCLSAKRDILVPREERFSTQSPNPYTVYLWIIFTSLKGKGIRQCTSVPLSLFIVQNLHSSIFLWLNIPAILQLYNADSACMFSVCFIDCVCKEGTAGVCVCLWKDSAK